MDEAKALIAEVIKKLALSTAESIAEKVKDFFVDREKKDQIDIGFAYEEYLNKVYDTYSKSKSLVYGSEARELLSFFQPVTISLAPEFSEKYDQKLGYHTKAYSEKISTERIEAVLNRSSKIIITGSGGTGKTVLMKYFCIKSIEEVRKIPVFMSLRWFNTVSIATDPFEELIYKQLKVFGFNLSYEYFLYSLEEDRYLFLFDGFDEIARERSVALSHMLSDFTKKFSKNYIIITSRKNERILGIDEYTIFDICPLSFSQAKNMIDKLEFGKDIKNRFINELNDGIYDKYQSFLSIPLLLSILFITYVEKTSLPETLNGFYEDAFETLLYRHDRKKEGFERVLESGLSYDSFRSVFMQFCFLTYFKDIYSFSESKLRENVNHSAHKLKKSFDTDSYIRDLVNVFLLFSPESFSGSLSLYSS